MTTRDAKARTASIEDVARDLACGIFGVAKGSMAYHATIGALEEVRSAVLEEAAKVVEDTAEQLGERACHGGLCMASSSMASRIRALAATPPPPEKEPGPLPGHCGLCGGMVSNGGVSCTKGCPGDDGRGYAAPIQPGMTKERP